MNDDEIDTLVGAEATAASANAEASLSGSMDDDTAVGMPAIPADRVEAEQILSDQDLAGLSDDGDDGDEEAWDRTEMMDLEEVERLRAEWLK